MTPQVLLLILFALVIMVIGWSLVRATRTGSISSRGWSFHRDKNPVGFWIVAAIDVAILAGITVYVVHTLG
jgi:hypothetical protein